MLASPRMQAHKGRISGWGHSSILPFQNSSWHHSWYSHSCLLTAQLRDTSQQILRAWWTDEHITAQLRKPSPFHWRAQYSLVPPYGRSGSCPSTQPQKFYLQHKTGEEGTAGCAGLAEPYFCSRLQTMTMPLASLEASRLSSQLKLTSSTGALWPCSLLTAALAARSTSKKWTHISSLPVTVQMRGREHQKATVVSPVGGPWGSKRCEGLM